MKTYIELKAMLNSRENTQQLITSLSLGSLLKNISTINNIIALLIFKNCHNTKETFDTMPIWNLIYCMDNLGNPFEPRFSIYGLYKQAISKFKTNQGWLDDINCNIRIRQGYHVSPTNLEFIYWSFGKVPKRRWIQGNKPSLLQHDSTYRHWQHCPLVKSFCRL